MVWFSNVKSSRIFDSVAEAVARSTLAPGAKISVLLASQQFCNAQLLKEAPWLLLQDMFSKDDMKNQTDSFVY